MINLLLNHRRDCPFYLAQSGFCMAPTGLKGPDLCVLGNELEVPLDCPLRNYSVFVYWHSLGESKDVKN